MPEFTQQAEAMVAAAQAAFAGTTNVKALPAGLQHCHAAEACQELHDETLPVLAQWLRDGNPETGPRAVKLANIAGAALVWSDYLTANPPEATSYSKGDTSKTPTVSPGWAGHPVAEGRRVQ